MPRIPLVEDLTAGPIPAGTQILVEYDSDSQWYNASVTIAAGWLKTGGKVSYGAQSQPPDEIRSQLGRLGLNVQQLEKNEKLGIMDMYTVSLGQTSSEKLAVESLRVADHSIIFSKELSQRPTDPESLVIRQNQSLFARFNDEKAWVEFQLTRPFPSYKKRKVTAIWGIMNGVHSEWAYRQLEGAADGIIDFKLKEVGRERKNLIGIRSMRNVGYNSRPHTLNIAQNFEVTLEK